MAFVIVQVHISLWGRLCQEWQQCWRLLFLRREGTGLSVWENSETTNKPLFSNLHQPLGEWRGWFFPNCVCHHSHMALCCQHSFMYKRSADVYLCHFKIKGNTVTFKIMFIHHRIIFTVFSVLLTASLFFRYKYKDWGFMLNLFYDFWIETFIRGLMSDEFAAPLPIILPLCLIVSLTALSFLPFHP